MLYLPHLEAFQAFALEGAELLFGWGTSAETGFISVAPILVCSIWKGLFRCYYDAAFDATPVSFCNVDVGSPTVSVSYSKSIVLLSGKLLACEGISIFTNCNTNYIMSVKQYCFSFTTEPPEACFICLTNTEFHLSLQALFETRKTSVKQCNFFSLGVSKITERKAFYV